MDPHQRREHPATDRGAAAVEFALVVLPLLLIVFGIINFGFIFGSQISMNSAARDAARAGVVQQLGGGGLDCAEIALLARNSGDAVGVSKSDVAVSVTGPGGTCTLPKNVASIVSTVEPCNTSSGAAQLIVVLNYAYKAPVGLVPPTSLTQTATGSFQCEYS